MSYILDALKRSEQERTRGDMPTLRTVRYDDDAAGFDFLQTTIGKVLIIALALAIGALIYSNRHSVMGTVDRQVDSDSDRQIVVADADQGSASLRNSQASNGKPGSTQPGRAQAAKPPVQVEQGLAPLPISEQPIAEVETSRKSELAGNAPLAAPQPAVPSQDIVETVVTPQFESQPVQDVPPTETPEVTVANVDTNTRAQGSADNVTKTKHDLPVDVRRNVPKILFSVVSFAQDPEKRFVMVNGDIFHEGEELTDTMLLKEITPNGPIVDFQGYEFLIKP